MILNKPNKQILFNSDLVWEKDDIGAVSSVSNKTVIHVSSPPEFGGKDAEWTPEHLFLSSITSCLMSTYLAFAKKIKFKNAGFECTATGQVDTIEGKYKFTFIHIYPKAYVTNEADVEKAQLALEKAKKYCLISNSINAEIIQHPEVVTAKKHAAINPAA
jgi:organic hydroperoxide reductase OsmC/OhrA